MKVHIIATTLAQETLCGRKQSQVVLDSYSVQRIIELRDAGRKILWFWPETGICKTCIKMYNTNFVFKKKHLLK